MATVGRRAGLTTAAAGLCLAGGAGPADAATGPVGYSPAKDVVAEAPLAVSITFGQPLRATGAILRLISSTGEDVGRGPIRTSHRTLRRQLRLGAPGGDYTIRWAATSANGHKMSGIFSFTAARSNVLSPNTPPAQASPATAPSAAATDQPTPSQAGEPSPSQAGEPSPTAGSTDAVIGQNQPSWVAEPPGQARSATSSAVDHRRGARGFTAVPLAVAGLLVLAAALVARLRRVHAS